MQRYEPNRLTPRLLALVKKTLLGENNRTTSPVEEDTANVVVTDGRLLGAGGHAERPEEEVHQDGELVDVLRLCLHHVEHNLVPLPHALGVRGADVVLDDDLPLPPAQPATHETLHLRGHNTLRVPLYSPYIVSLHINK